MSQVQTDSLPPHEPASEQPEKPEARFGPPKRLIGTLFSPGETFEDVNRKPTWLVPLVLMVLISAAATFFIFSWVKPDWNQVIRTQMRRQIERTGQQMPPESVIEQQVAISKITIPIVSVVYGPFITLVIAGVFTLALLLVQAQTTFKKILSVVAWSWCATDLVRVLVMMLVIFVNGPQAFDPTQTTGMAVTNLAAFLSTDANPVLKSIARQFDVFTIWFLILLSIGFSTISAKRKATRGPGKWVVIIVFAIWIIFRAAMAAVIGQ